MATRSRGWTLQRDPRTGVYFVRFRHGNGRFNRSTKTTDRRIALREAARIYDAATHGVARTTSGRAPALDELVIMWLADYSASHSPRTVVTYTEYSARFVLTFRTLHGVTAHATADYARTRLREVRAITVRKELSALRSFVSWLVDAGHLTEAPLVPSIPKRAVGVPGKWADGADRSQRRIDLAPDVAGAIMDRLPDVSRGGHAHRDIVRLIWETTLRIGTIERLESPRHYVSGSDTLRITADIDKARYARDLPLSRLAREILDRHCPDKPGPIFGPVRLQSALGSAALAVGLPPEDARKVGPYDLRHAAMTHVASAPMAPLAGIAYLAGHRHVSTTARYVHAARGAAEAALAARDAHATGTPSGTRKPRARDRGTRAKRKSPKK